MKLAWKRLEKESGYGAALALLASLYRQETGGELPPIWKTPQGKPFFADSRLHFSVSHTKRHAFCCIHEENVGIDAEETDRIVDPAVARRLFSPGEQQRIASAQDPNGALLRLWVLKESYAKLTGRGLGNYLRETDFSPEDPRIREIDGCYVAVLTER